MKEKIEFLLYDLYDDFLLHKKLNEEIIEEIFEIAISNNKKQIMNDYIKDVIMFILYENTDILIDKELPIGEYSKQLLDKES